MTRPSLALAMIVKNEAHNLPKLFESVKDCYDEIHITDTGSTDGTQEVIKKHGAKLHHFEWVDDFAAARNASFAPVKTDFVMWLDGDDVLQHSEYFKLWRDNAMGLYDFWLATYHYSMDASGEPNCSFARERVFRVSKGLKWRYFVHEGVIPEEDGKQVTSNFASSWSVKHMRTDDDLKADRSRNLSMFESRENSLDPRMKFYYGKELFEAGRS